MIQPVFINLLKLIYIQIIGVNEKCSNSKLIRKIPIHFFSTFFHFIFGYCTENTVQFCNIQLNCLPNSYIQSWRTEYKRTHAEVNFQFKLNYPKSDCIYRFPIDFYANEIPVGSKSIGKW